MRLPLATFVNMLTVALGALIGLALQQVIPENMQSIVFQAIGLGTLVIGISMSLKIPDGYVLIFIFSLIVGGITGELLHIGPWMHEMGDVLKSWFSIGEARFTDGLITAFLLFCVGSMTIVGAIEEGLRGKRELLLIKSTLDGFTAIALASTYGIGVGFSILPMLFFQGGITILAGHLQHFFTAKIIAMLSATGGVLIIAVSLNMLQLGHIRLESLLPAILIVVLLTWGWDAMKRNRT